MLMQLLEAALRSFALGSAVWLSLRFLRVHNPQTRMTAWTVVLMASLSMPVLMHWATVPIPAYMTPPHLVIAHVSPATTARPPVQPTELLLENMDAASAAEDAGVASRSKESPFADALLVAIDWPALATGFYLAMCAGLLLRLAIGLALTWRLLRRDRRIQEDWTAGLDVRLSTAVATPVPSRPREFHPEPLADPDLNLSIYPARATARRLPPSVECWVPPVTG
jgi:hypothetical protein